MSNLSILVFVERGNGRHRIGRLRALDGHRMRVTMTQQMSEKSGRLQGKVAVITGIDDSAYIVG